MLILHRTKSFKVKHRKANWELKIIVHENSINNIRSIISEQSKEFFETLISTPFVDDNHLEELLNSDIERYKTSVKIQTFWTHQLLKIPIVKTDGRLKVGEYELNDYLCLIIRNSERYKDQVIELIKNNKYEK